MPLRVLALAPGVSFSRSYSNRSRNALAKVL